MNFRNKLITVFTVIILAVSLLVGVTIVSTVYDATSTPQEINNLGIQVKEDQYEFLGYDEVEKDTFVLRDLYGFKMYHESYILEPIDGDLLVKHTWYDDFRTNTTELYRKGVLDE